MRQASKGIPESAEKTVRDIRRATPPSVLCRTRAKTSHQCRLAADSQERDAIESHAPKELLKARTGGRTTRFRNVFAIIFWTSRIRRCTSEFRVRFMPHEL
jgi:hypothetical protein